MLRSLPFGTFARPIDPTDWLTNIYEPRPADTGTVALGTEPIHADGAGRAVDGNGKLHRGQLPAVSSIQHAGGLFAEMASLQRSTGSCQREARTQAIHADYTNE
jgi:hypothetical protein